MSEHEQQPAIVPCILEDLLNDALFTCPVCNTEQAPEEAFMGVLGNTIHYRCCACGAQWHEEQELQA